MSVGYLFSGAIGHLPMLAVLIAGFVLVGQRRERLGQRSTLMANLGLSALMLSQILSLIWTLTLPQLIRVTDYASTSYGLLTFAVNLVITLLAAIGIGLLLAALVTRTPAGVPTRR
ncbi:hypothetical protein [Actinoplanes sp. TFC3]|uniref:hypothetical protein n=1 Tax=Actinoplanes sp. TFC3 TaxID=1710355 RepID=UPI00082AD865|nr:hypothetical protein [Actinoplanes sp. TFC3]